MKNKFPDTHKNQLKKTGLFSEVSHYMKSQKRWWLTPLLIVIVLFGILILVAELSPIGPLIYTLF